MVMSKKFILAAFLAASMLLPAGARAAGLEISIGDRGYYTHGARYWDGDYEMIWVPGHREGRHWVHGYYRRGEHRRHHHHDDRHDH